ncbi:MAG: 23S rRNA (pseudouridine(1915)-N(3))-methyltransferase RlmH [Deltaproteobacteria bacterium]|nr:23S rRNA (pseudouridine(1915)-N(3))-methyltransferase RlmH [Deltaproteobacteria bacterium]
MKITFISVGSVKDPCMKDRAADYLKRIRRYSPIEAVEVKEEPSPAKMPKAEVIKREGERIIKKVKGPDFVIALSESGKEFTSAGFAGFLDSLLSGASGKKGVSFVIGGPFGLHIDVIKRADALLSLSKMTLPHDLARLMLLEQVFRAFTILRGEPYSH